MILKEFLKIINYNDVNISKEKDGSLELIFKISEYTPIEFLSEKFLCSEIDTVFIDEDFKENGNDLIDIVIKLEE